MSYIVKSGAIFPYIELDNFNIQIMKNIDLTETEMDFVITSGNICAYRRENIPQKDLVSLIEDGGIYSELTNANLASLIELNQNKILHFVENHEDYMKGPPYPNYENIEE